LLSGKKRTALTLPSWSRSCTVLLPVSRSHSSTLRSLPPETTIFPSAANRVLVTQFEWPSSERTNLRVAAW
jgi:hypothetical protein